MTFTVAVIGRPNVGKSTLFNRLVGKKLALVDDRPGVTRDRREAEGHLGDLSFMVIDTAGLEEAGAATLEGRMREQTEAAIEDADALLFVMDARTGLVPQDQSFAELARRSGKPIIVIANKAEGRNAEVGSLDAFRLGLGEPVALSAEHGEGMADLYQRLVTLFPEMPAQLEDSALPRSINVAIVGRPNAGKSTLINRLLGEERLLTGPEAGITRDSIAVDFNWKDQKIRLFDTAGLRKRARVEDKLEKLSVADALRAIRFAEVVVVLMDATHPFEEQDLRIADLVEREGRAIVLGMNKWDLSNRQQGAMGSLREEADHWLPQIRGAPIIPVSGLTGQGLDRLLDSVITAYDVWNRRVATADLNRWLEEALAANPPPAVQGRRIKIKYITQIKSRPPTFALFGNQLSALPDSYRRYLVNSIRQTLDFGGAPVRIMVRGAKNPYDKSRRT